MQKSGSLTGKSQVSEQPHVGTVSHFGEGAKGLSSSVEIGELGNVGVVASYEVGNDHLSEAPISESDASNQPNGPENAAGRGENVVTVTNPFTAEQLSKLSQLGSVRIGDAWGVGISGFPVQQKGGFFSWFEEADPLQEAIENYQGALLQISKAECLGQKANLEGLNRLSAALHQIRDGLRIKPSLMDNRHWSNIWYEIGSEIEVMQALYDSISSQNLPETLSLGVALSYMREGFSPNDAALLREFEISAPVARYILQHNDPPLTLDEVVLYKAFGFDVFEIREFKKLGGTLEVLAPRKNGNSHRTEGAESPDEQKAPTDAERLAAKLSILKGAQEAADKKFLSDYFKNRNYTEQQINYIYKSYRRAKVPINEHTMVTKYRTVVGEPQKVRGGNCSKVYRTTYQLADGQKQEVIFKEETGENFGTAATHSGIEHDNPKVGLRNIAVSRLAALLGYSHIVPHAEFAWQNGVLGIAMERCDEVVPVVKGAKDEVLDISSTKNGQYAFKHREQLETDPKALKLFCEQIGARDILFRQKADTLGRWYLHVYAIMDVKELPIDKNDPELQKGLVDLSWFDAFTGGGDRHSKNYHIIRNGEGKVVRVVGIDNDVSFGKKLRHPNDFRFGKNSKDRSVFYGIGMPGIIDENIKKAFLGLTEEAVRQVLVPFLDADEIDSTLSRLSEIQNYLRGDDCLVGSREGSENEENLQWGTPSALIALGSGSGGPDRANNYWERDQHRWKNRFLSVGFRFIEHKNR